MVEPFRLRPMPPQCVFVFAWSIFSRVDQRSVYSVQGVTMLSRFAGRTDASAR